MTPRLARTRTDLAAVRGGLPAPVVVVPTMGALHAGHRALLRRARELAGRDGSVLVTIFVNPLQFGPAEDFDRYPRPLDADLEVCAAEGVAAVFAPDRREMYPQATRVTVDPGPAGRVLEGEFRPGFFGGVLTVVLKLFQLTRPDIAVFGRKDAQQLALVRQMVADLDLGVRIEAVDTVRDADCLGAPRAGTPTCPPRTGRPRSRSRQRSRQARTPRPAGRDRCCRRRAGYSAGRPATGRHCRWITSAWCIPRRSPRSANGTQARQCWRSPPGPGPLA